MMLFDVGGYGCNVTFMGSLNAVKYPEDNRKDEDRKIQSVLNFPSNEYTTLTSKVS
jgi:hypothetical protein